MNVWSMESPSSTLTEQPAEKTPVVEPIDGDSNDNSKDESPAKGIMAAKVLL